MRRAALALAVVAAVATLDVDARQPRAVGMVLEVRGSVFLRPATTGTEVVLDRIRDAARVLYEGQAIRSGPGGQVRMRLASAVKTLTADEGRYELRYSTAGTSSERATLAALNAYARPGGSRALGSLLYSPAPDGVVRVDALDVRWTPRDQGGPLALTVTAGSATIWSIADLPASAGRLPPAALSSLKAAIATGPAAGGSTVTFTLRENGAVLATVPCRVLSRADDATLAARLREWDGDAEPLARAIGRAYELGALRLYNEAADEFERALALAPGSDAILRAAIAAHERTGNVARANALNTRLR